VDGVDLLGLRALIPRASISKTLQSSFGCSGIQSSADRELKSRQIVNSCIVLDLDSPATRDAVAADAATSSPGTCPCLSTSIRRRLNAARLGRKDPTALIELGHLLESFVVGELLKQTSWLDDVIVAGHWRTRDGEDLILERDDGAIVAVEVKASSPVPGKTSGPCAS
jgi:hypothetical protein